MQQLRWMRDLDASFKVERKETFSSRSLLPKQNWTVQVLTQWILPNKSNAKEESSISPHKEYQNDI
jgi:hypothetical protein